MTCKMHPVGVCSGVRIPANVNNRVGRLSRIELFERRARRWARIGHGGRTALHPPEVLAQTNEEPQGDTVAAPKMIQTVPSEFLRRTADPMVASVLTSPADC